jgi:hypothetical protein
MGGFWIGSRVRSNVLMVQPLAILVSSPGAPRNGKPAAMSPLDATRRDPA